MGRGPGSGSGKTAGRGQKGQKARSGGAPRPSFEGGQMPLHRRIPKRGFTNIFRTEYQVVNLRELDGFDGVVDLVTLREHGLTGSTRKLVKILGDGEARKALHVTVHAVSGSARKKIEDAGGSVTLLGAGDRGDEGRAEGGQAQDQA